MQIKLTTQQWIDLAKLATMFADITEQDRKLGFRDYPVEHSIYEAPKSLIAILDPDIFGKVEITG